MDYGVPQLGRCMKTKRVKQLRLYARQFSEEQFLTRLVQGLDDRSLEMIVLKFKDDSEIHYPFEE